MSKKPQFQQKFTNEGLETPDSVESKLNHHGIDIDTREKESRLETAKASEFGIDDRPEETREDSGEQAGLFTYCDKNQQSLTGGSAANNPLFSNEGDD